MFFVLFLVELAFTVSDIFTISAAATEDDIPEAEGLLLDEWERATA